MPNYTNSVWTEDSRVAPRHPRLRGIAEYDVVIIGAGITGITTARLLKAMGKRVAVLESRRVGKGETAHTTAHLTWAIDERYHRLISRFGENKAGLVAQSQKDAINRIAKFVNELEIECDFQWVPGFLYTEHQSGIEEIDREAEACWRLGLDVSLQNHAPLSFPTRRALRFENQAQFHPRHYLLALADTIAGDGSHIFEDSHVFDVKEEGNHCRVATEEGEVLARDVVIAANVPVVNRFFMATKIPAYRTYVIAARLPQPQEPALFWDTETPYHYIRTHRDHEGVDYLVVGGADHKVGQLADTTQPYTQLESYLAARFGALPVDYRWAGQIIEPLDGLPYIGRNALSSHVFVATGFAGQGLTMGTLAAMILTDTILDRSNPYADVYRATRIQPLRSARRFVSENIDFPSHLLRDRLHRDRTPMADIPAGEGAVLTVQGERLAVYRDHAGDLRALSPVCTHMACLVQWNTTEKSWDCPCHGSRFDPTGRVLNGPATQPLSSRPLPPDTHKDEALDEISARAWSPAHKNAKL